MVCSWLFFLKSKELLGPGNPGDRRMVSGPKPDEDIEMRTHFVCASKDAQRPIPQFEPEILGRDSLSWNNMVNRRTTGENRLPMRPNARREAPTGETALLRLLSILLPMGCASGGGHTPADAGAANAGEAGQAVSLPPPLDPRAIGAFDLAKVTVAAFSQTTVSQSDRQVLALAPDLVPRAFSQWDVSGLKASDYAWSYPAACHANNTLFVGGLTASVIFADQMSASEFADEVTLVSPDLAADQPATFSYTGGQLTVNVGALVSSVAVVID